MMSEIGRRYIMVKRKVEIEDDLNETVDTLKEEVCDHFLEYLKENPDCDDFDQYYQAGGCDAVHEFSNSSTPIYYSDIDGLYYLYGDEFDEAYTNAGIGDGSENNHRQVAIYCYLSEKAFEYQRELQDSFEEYLADEDEAKTIGQYIS